MPEMYLKQPGFTYAACGSFTKNKGQMKKFEETWDSRYIYQKELSKACFQHDIAYGDVKDLNRGTFADKVLRDKTFNIATKDLKYDRYQRGLVSMIYKFLLNKTSASRIKNENTSNKELAEELHKPIIRKFNKTEVH